MTTEAGHSLPALFCGKLCGQVTHPAGRIWADIHGPAQVPENALEPRRHVAFGEGDGRNRTGSWRFGRPHHSRSVTPPLVLSLASKDSTVAIAARQRPSTFTANDSAGSILVPFGVPCRCLAAFRVLRTGTTHDGALQVFL